MASNRAVSPTSTELVGQVMKASGGKANPQAVNDLLKKKIGI
jgi:Asp-tRNA(Asn)/Glu-tRNA(Gln) amidotransferase B subunit